MFPGRRTLPLVAVGLLLAPQVSPEEIYACVGRDKTLRRLSATQQCGRYEQRVTLNQPAPNPLRSALLRWDNAGVSLSYSVGTAPRGVAFDGGSIWVTNEEDALGIDLPLVAEIVWQWRARRMGSPREPARGV
jgi:hypothetical protein